MRRCIGLTSGFDETKNDRFLAVTNRSANGNRFRDLVKLENRVDCVMSIFRAQSWPLLDSSSKTSGLKDQVLSPNKNQDSKNEGEKKTASHQANSNPQIQARRLLWRHYYPEGGWGWIITVVGTLVHLIGSGLQLSAPASLTFPASIKFHHPPLHTSGKL